MTTIPRATTPTTDRAASSGVATALYLAKEQCAERYAISWRHWLRLVDRGAAPQPIRFGASVRWAVADLEAWEADGCRPVVSRKRGGAA